MKEKKELDKMNANHFKDISDTKENLDILDIKEERELDEFISVINNEEIPVPEELEINIKKRIVGFKPHKKNYGRKAATACVLLCFLFIGAVKISPEFAAYASNVPVLHYAVEWLIGDEGIQNAKEHGYKGLGPLTITEDGYVLTLDNIFFDEDRIRLSAAVIGKKIIEMEAQRSSHEHEEEVVIKDVREEDFAEPVGIPSISVKFRDFEHPGACQSYDGDSFTTVAEKTFEPGELKEFLATSPEFLHIDVSIGHDEEVIHEFATLKVPINKEIFKQSKIFLQNKEISLEHTNIKINDLTISPTRMKLNLNFQMEEGYFFTGFENPYLQDEKGNIYKPEGLISTNKSAEERIVYFVPSVYFEMPQKLYFCFDGVRIGSEEGKSFTLSLQEEYPKKMEYIGQELEITDVELTQKGDKTKLTIVTKMWPTKVLEMQGIDIEDYRGTKSWSEYDDIDEKGNKCKFIGTTFYNVIKKDEYEVEWEYPGYLIKAPTKYLLNLK